MTKVVLLTLGLLAYCVVGTKGNEKNACPESWHHHKSSGTCVKVYNNQRASWEDSRRICQQEDADLVVIRDASMNELVRGLLKYDQCWIGGTVIDHKKKLIRFVGEKEPTQEEPKTLPLYENWYPGEPNYHGGREKCVEIYYKSSGKWNDNVCSRQQPFVCQKPDLVTIVGINFENRKTLEMDGKKVIKQGVDHTSSDQQGHFLELNKNNFHYFDHKSFDLKANSCLTFWVWRKEKNNPGVNVVVVTDWGDFPQSIASDKDSRVGQWVETYGDIEPKQNERKLMISAHIAANRIDDPLIKVDDILLRSGTCESFGYN